MTVVCVLADPPREGLVLPDLPETTPLTESEAARLYAASFRDVCRHVADSGGDLLVNYRPEDALSERFHTDTDPEAQLRATVAEALGGTDDVRFEPQVGETYAGRVGNTVTHLLEQEDAASAAVLSPTAPLAGRTVIDQAAMKLRRHEVVLGPATEGQVYYAGFTEPVDFEAAFATPAIETLTDRGRDAGHEVDFLRTVPAIESGRDLVTVTAAVRARERAGRTVPEHTAAVVADLGLRVTERDGEATLVRN